MHAPPILPGSAVQVGVPPLQAVQAAPLAPQAVFAVPGWQAVPSQQPVPQLALVASQTHAPLVHVGVVPLQTAHALPTGPQAATVVPG